MSLRDIAESRKVSKQLEKEALLSTFFSEKQEFYNRCHGEDGRFCEGVDGPGSARDSLKGKPGSPTVGKFLGTGKKRKAQKESESNKESEEEFLHRIVNQPRDFQKIHDIKVDSGEISIGDPAYYDDAGSASHWDVHTSKVPNGTFDVSTDKDGKSVRIGLSPKASGPYKSIGNIGVDSGTIMIGDSKKMSSWDEVIKDSAGNKAYKPVKLQKGGVLVHTYIGDGVYPVSAQHNESGEIQSLRVDFDWD